MRTSDAPEGEVYLDTKRVESVRFLICLQRMMF